MAEIMIYHLFKDTLDDFHRPDIDFRYLQKNARKCVEPTTGGDMASFVERNQNIKNIIIDMIRMYTNYDENIELCDISVKAKYMYMHILCAAYMAIDDVFYKRTKLYALLSSSILHNIIVDNISRKNTIQTKTPYDWMSKENMLKTCDFYNVCLREGIPIYDTPAVQFLIKDMADFNKNTGIYLNEVINNSFRSSPRVKLWNDIFCLYICNDKYRNIKNSVELILNDNVDNISKVYKKYDKRNIYESIYILFKVRYLWGCTPS